MCGLDLMDRKSRRGISCGKRKSVGLVDEE